MVGQFQGNQRFRIIRQLGVGGTGIVYLAHDRHRNTEVALKTLHQTSPYGILRLKNEFRQLAEVAHENLVALHDLHHEGGAWFFTMDYIDGTDFIDWVRPRDALIGQRSLDKNRLRDALEQLARGVSALHAAGHLHRDIKPSNILVTHVGRVVLLDFGLATPLERIDVRDIRGFSGTLEYMAPEQTDGRTPVPASDWYSVGVLLFQALTGRLPFVGKPLQVALDKRRLDGPAPSSVRADVDADLDDLCTHLLRLKPDERATESMLFDALEAEPDESLSYHSIGGPPIREMPRLIGRESQLGSLISAVGTVRQGRSVLVSLHGQSGMGKSALVKYFIESLRGRKDVMLVKGRCYQREALPYKAFDSVIDDLTRQLGRLPSIDLDDIIPNHIGRLARLFPVLLNLPAIASRTNDDQDSQDRLDARGAAFAALRTLLTRLSKKRLLIIHIDDVHWGDRDSAELLSDIVRLPDAPPIMIVCSWHTERIQSGEFVRPLRLLLARSSDQFIGRELEVGPLEETHARSLARYLLAEHGCSSRFLEHIVDEAAGHPFFMETLVGHVARAETAEHARETLQTGNFSLNAVVSMRVKCLEQSALRLLQTIAVAGQPLPRTTAVAVSSLSSQADRIIGVLKADRLIKERTPGQEELLEPYHDRIREVVLQTIDAELAHLLHHEIAIHLERQTATAPEALVDHFLDAGDYDRALQYATESAHRANEKLAFDRAALLYEQALDLHRESVTIPASLDALDEERTLLCSLASALANGGKARQAAKVYRAAASGAPTMERDQLLLRAGELLFADGDIEQALATLMPVLSDHDLNITDDAPLTALILEARADCEGLIAETLVASKPTIDDERKRFVIDLCWALALGLLTHHWTKAQVYHLKALRMALVCGEATHIARSLSLDALIGSLTSDAGATQTMKRANDALEMAQAVNRHDPLGLAELGIGSMHFFYGDWMAASHHLEQAIHFLRESDQPRIWARIHSQLLALSAFAMRGQFKTLTARVLELMDQARENQLTELTRQLRMGYAQLGWLALDEPHRLAEPSVHLESSNGTTDYLMLIARVHTALYRGQFKTAAALVCRSDHESANSKIAEIEFIEREMASLRIRCRIGQLVIGSPRPAIEDEIRHDLLILRRNGVEWSRRLADFFETYLTYLSTDRTVDIPVADDICRALENSSLEAYAAVARIRFGTLMGCDMGSEWVAKGEAFMVEQAVRKPAAFSQIFAPV
ncbi:MAG: protein kinase [Myxococcota bacterium]|nr:protein kinase [Myxococcota bacterium]